MSGVIPPDLPPCPVCREHLQVVYDRNHQVVAVCVECHTSVTIPDSAWEVRYLKRDVQWQSKRSTG